MQVHLIVPARSKHRLADLGRERALRQLSTAGARVWLAPGMVHAKAVVIDDSMALTGSVNLDARSLFLNYEHMTAFYDREPVQWLAHWCARHIATAQPHHARQPSWLRDIAEGKTLGDTLQPATPGGAVAGGVVLAAQPADPFAESCIVEILGQQCLGLGPRMRDLVG